jgi:hypothetical protein
VLAAYDDDPDGPGRDGVGRNITPLLAGVIVNWGDFERTSRLRHVEAGSPTSSPSGANPDEETSSHHRVLEDWRSPGAVASKRCASSATRSIT